MQAATGRQPAELCTPACPVSLAYVIGLFHELSSVRASGFNSQLPIGWADMRAWSQITDTPLSSLEARLLRLLDATWIKAWSDGQPKSAESPRA